MLHLIYKTSIAALAASAACIAPADTNPPPQVQTLRVAAGTELPDNYDTLLATYKMANNGTSPTYNLMSVFYNANQSVPTKAFVLQRDQTGEPFLALQTQTGTTLSEAFCGTYAGYYGGRQNSTSNPIVPTWWQGSGSANPIANNGYVGRFWDVNQDNYYCGYYDESGSKQAYWHLSPDLNAL